MNSPENEYPSVSDEEISARKNEGNESVTGGEAEFVDPLENSKDKTDNSQGTEPSDSEKKNEFEYVVPTKKSRFHRRHHHHHSSDSSSAKRKKLTGVSPEERRDATDGFVFYAPRNSKRRRVKRRAKRIAMIVLIVLGSTIIAAGSAFLILRQIGDSQMHNYENVEIALPEDSEQLASESLELQNEGKTIRYNGETYVLNEKVASVVFIGVDDNIEDERAMMSDAIYIIAIDSATNRVSIISVSRDTITDVDVYSGSGSFIETEKTQLSYAYSFSGDGKNGAENTTSALSKMFFGLPFNNYFAMDMDALIQLNDAIGGVEVTSMMTFTSPIDGSTIEEGERVKLVGMEAETYITARDHSELGSNNDRMARQKQYIGAFLESIIPAVKSDISLVSDLYGLVRVNSTTSLTVPQMTYLASSVIAMISDPSEIEFRGIEGEMKAGEHAEFYPDDKALLELMLDVFYNKSEQ